MAENSVETVSATAGKSDGKLYTCWLALREIGRNSINYCFYLTNMKCRRIRGDEKGIYLSDFLSIFVLDNYTLAL